MTDSVQEHENAPESAHILARIAEVLKENPENGLETVREAFEAERERAQKALREHAQDFDSLKEVRLGFFGDKGSLSLANRQMRDLENQHKGPVGKLLGQARAALTEAIEARTAELEASGRCHRCHSTPFIGWASPCCVDAGKTYRYFRGYGLGSRRWTGTRVRVV